jgi:hypothetical protein
MLGEEGRMEFEAALEKCAEKFGIGRIEDVSEA